MSRPTGPPFDGQDLGTLSVDAGGSALEHVVVPTGQTVGEPNQNWHIDNFVSHPLGAVELPGAGVHEITMKVRGGRDRPVKFQWLWLIGEGDGKATR